jgi:two-component system sensor histidine kinase/response regulator
MTVRETTRGENFGRGAMVAATLIFIVLGLSLATVMTLYRTAVLEPRLRDEARAQAEILSRSQAGLIAGVLRNTAPEGREAALDAALDELLLLRDPASNQAYFDFVAVELDHEALGAPPETLDRGKGDLSSSSAFASSVALYDPKTSEVLGLVRFGVSSRLFRELSAKVGDELFRVTLAVLALLFVLWIALMMVLAQLEGQTAKRFAAERELSRQEKRYERLVNNLNQYFVYRKDAQGRLLSVSDSVQRVLGFTPAEFAARHTESLRLASSNSTAQSGSEVELEDAHGHRHRIELSEVTVSGEDGALVAIDGIARDATAERRFREELQHAKDEAEAANQAKSRFLANMSHEIRTPLNAILGMTGLALRSIRAPRERDYLEKVRVSARLLAEIVEDILDLSRIESGKLELVLETFDLEEMLAEISDVIGVRAGARGLEVTFQPVGRLPRHLSGDPVRLKQVLLNLLNNAVKFTERGDIVARIEATEMRRDRAVLRFTITDTGIGIPESHLNTLFEPFTQVDNSNARRYGGMGLGLAISRRLVRLMGGDIVVATSVGEGSTFTFTATFGLPEGASESRRLPEALAGVNALVVDDNESARVALSGMLEMLACRVDAVASGEEAMRAFEQAREHSPYRIALVDWKMPGMDGIETASRLRALAGESPLGLILVTAHDWEEAAKRGEGAGIATVLHKPLSPSGLHDALVTTLLPWERLRAAAPGGSMANFASGQTVLLVEDQVINRELARELLTQAGLVVREATNGRAALDELARSRPDVVLMDVQMPDMDGLAAVGLIRADPELASLPVIAMTAHAMMGDRERFLAAGMSDYVAKPIEEAQLFRVLGRWLRSQSGDVAPPEIPERSTDPARQAEESSSSHTLDRVAGLRRAAGNRALYDRLVRNLVTEAPDLVDRLRSSAARGDAEAVRRDLHTLKGNAATVSALEIATLAGGLERAAELPSPDDLDALLAAVGRLGALAPAPPPALTLGTNDAATVGLTPERRLQALEALRRLADHVASGNLAARRSLADLQGALGGAFPGPLRDLENAVSHLDFPAASREIESLLPLLDSEVRS